MEKIVHATRHLGTFAVNALQAKGKKHHHHAQMSPDEKVTREWIAGRVEGETAIDQIRYGRGFPVWTSRGTVLFIYVGEGENLRVAGDFNDWNPFPMTRSEAGVWFAEIRIPKSIGQRLRYRYVREENTWFSDPLARCFFEQEDGEISFIKKPCGRWYLMRWDHFRSPQGLKPRPIHVLVPPNAGPYDVLYAHDGQNLFSRDSMCGGWKICENMAEISGNFLVVGIGNTEDRMSEYTHAGDTYDLGYHATLGRQYAAFVEETVRPFIEGEFPTTSKAGLMGSSLGGLISLYISNCYPGRYASVFALSPTTAWGRFSDDHGPTIRDYYEKSGHQDTFLYVDHGGEFPDEGQPQVLDRKIALRDESEWASAYDNCCYTFDFVSALVEIGYRQSVDMFYEHIRGARHNENAWAARVSKPLQLFMKG